MEVPATPPADDPIERADVTVNAYEVFWDCVESGPRPDAAPAAGAPGATDAYAKFWMEADG
jgi:hypothetical protein